MKTLPLDLSRGVSRQILAWTLLPLLASHDDGLCRRLANAAEDQPGPTTLVIRVGTADPRIDLDTTPDGQRRLGELERRAQDLNISLDAIQLQLAPHVKNLVQLQNALQIEAARHRTAQNTITRSELAIRQLNQQMLFANQAMKAQLQMQVNSAQQNITVNKAVAAAAEAEAMKHKAAMNALEVTMKPIIERKQKTWNELEECRKQWLKIRQPIEKYSRGDYEQLRNVLDDWLLNDGLYPEANMWAALCAYEMGQFDDARGYLKRIENLQVDFIDLRVSRPLLTAMNGLISYRNPREHGIANRALSAARGTMDKKRDWETYFILGYAYSTQPEYHNRAAAYLNQCLEINPECLFAEVVLARLQVLSTDKNVTDIPAGVTSLEKAWKETGERSWRLAYYLVEAHDAAGNNHQSDAYWRFVANNAPQREINKLFKQRKDTKARIEQGTN